MLLVVQTAQFLWQLSLACALDCFNKPSPIKAALGSSAH